MEYLRFAFRINTNIWPPFAVRQHPFPWVQMDHQGAMCPMFYDSQMNNSTHVNIMNHSQQGCGPLIRFSI